jgi:hypothetical protein
MINPFRLIWRAIVWIVVVLWPQRDTPQAIDDDIDFHTENIDKDIMEKHS